MYTKLLKLQKLLKNCLGFKVIEITFFWELNAVRDHLIMYCMLICPFALFLEQMMFICRNIQSTQLQHISSTFNRFLRATPCGLRNRQRIVKTD